MVKQPRGGYVNISDFQIEQLKDDRDLSEKENINPALIGLTVDYLTRYMINNRVEEAFMISALGAKRAEILGRKGALKEICEYLVKVEGLDNQSIINACKATAFDVWFRNPIVAMTAKSAKEINPDEKTINNIRIMVERSLFFWLKYGPITKDGFTFEKDGYTKTVSSGDGDYLTEDTLWDFKVLKEKPQSKDTLQILMYYIMGIHSGKEEFKNINKIGIYNPRLNLVYQLEIDKIPRDIIKEIEEEVICYEQ